MLVRKLGTRSTKNNLRCIEVADFQIPRILNNVAEGRGGGDEPPRLEVSFHVSRVDGQLPGRRLIIVVISYTVGNI